MQFTDKDTAFTTTLKAAVPVAVGPEEEAAAHPSCSAPNAQAVAHYGDDGPCRRGFAPAAAHKPEQDDGRPHLPIWVPHQTRNLFQRRMPIGNAKSYCFVPRLLRI